MAKTLITLICKRGARLTAASEEKDRVTPALSALLLPLPLFTDAFPRRRFHVVAVTSLRFGGRGGGKIRKLLQTAERLPLGMDVCRGVNTTGAGSEYFVREAINYSWPPHCV